MYQNTKFLYISGVLALIYEYQRKLLIDLGFYKQAFDTYKDQKFFLSDNNSEYFWDKKLSEKDFSFPMEEWRNKKVVSLIDRSKSLLNVGVGIGFFEEKLFNKYKFIKYVGTDITENTLQKLRKKFPNNKFIKSKILHLPFKNKLFDQILLLEVLEHIKPSETFLVLAEINRLLKDDGTFIISVPVNEGLEKIFPQNPSSHMRAYSEQLIIFELLNSGFKIKKVYRVSAFNKLFSFKHVLNIIFCFEQPNNLILVCRK